MVKMILDGATATGNAESIQSLVMTVVMLGIFFVVFYFMLIRPQKKKEKELKKQLEAMRVGDKVLTIGGLVGVIANIKDDEVTIYTSSVNTPVTFKKEAIQSVALRNAEQAAPKAEKKAKKETTEE